MNPIKTSILLAIAAVSTIAGPYARAQEAKSVEATAPPSAHSMATVFARVNGTTITQAEFQNAFVNHVRQKFYHGQVPQEQLKLARQQVADQLVERLLFLEEVERRGIVADEKAIEKQIEEYDRRYGGSPNWQQSREAMLPGLRQVLAQQDRLKALEEQVRNLPVPGVEASRAFYQAKPDLFTEPEKLRLRTILLSVNPSSPAETWQAARDEGQKIVQRIRAGASFEDQARLSSNDPSAENGGDMGYLHRGMLPDGLLNKIDEFKLGEVTDPIEILQGIAIFRLDEKLPAKLQPFEGVAERARDLLHREQREQAWSAFVAKLRSGARIEMLDSPGEAKPLQ